MKTSTGEERRERPTSGDDDAVERATGRRGGGRREGRRSAGLRVEHAGRREQTDVDGGVGVDWLEEKGEGGGGVLLDGALRGRVDEKAVAGDVVEKTGGRGERDGARELDGNASAVGEEAERGGRRDGENACDVGMRRGFESEENPRDGGGEMDLARFVEKNTPETAAVRRDRQRENLLFCRAEETHAHLPGLVGMERRRRSVRGSELTANLSGNGGPEANEDRRRPDGEDPKLEIGRMEGLRDHLGLVLHRELRVVGDRPGHAVPRVRMQSSNKQTGEVSEEQRMGHVAKLLTEHVVHCNVDRGGDGQLQHVHTQIRVFGQHFHARYDRRERVERRTDVQKRVARVFCLGLHVHQDPAVPLGDGDRDGGEMITRRDAAADSMDSQVRNVHTGELARGGHAETKENLAEDQRTTGEPADRDEVDGDQRGGDVERELGAERGWLEGEDGGLQRKERGFVERERVGDLVGALGKQRARNRDASDLATGTIRSLLAGELFAPLEGHGTDVGALRGEREDERGGRERSAVRKDDSEGESIG